MPLGMEVGLDPGDNVLDGDPAPPTERGTAAFPHFLAHFALAGSPISTTAELLFIIPCPTYNRSRSTPSPDCVNSEVQLNVEWNCWLHGTSVIR